MDDNTLNTTRLKALVARIAAGDKAARDELLRAVAGRLEVLARKMLWRFPNVRRFAETDDVHNGALVRLVRALENHVRPDSMRSFYGLAAEQIRRELIDLARHFHGPRAQTLSLAVLQQGNHEFAAQGTWQPQAPENEHFERWCAFHEAVGQLPAEQREVVGLTFYHGWSQEEVAEVLQVTPRTVRRWWTAAMVTLRYDWKDDDL